MLVGVRKEAALLRSVVRIDQLIPNVSNWYVTSVFFICSILGWRGGRGAGASGGGAGASGGAAAGPSSLGPHFENDLALAILQSSHLGEGNNVFKFTLKNHKCLYKIDYQKCLLSACK